MLFRTADLINQIDTTLRRYAEEFDAVLRGLDRDVGWATLQRTSYGFSRALAVDLNAATHLEHEVNANLFGVPYLQDFENKTLCGLWVQHALPNLKQDIRYCSAVGSKLLMCDDCADGWNVTVHQILRGVDDALGETFEAVDPATAFLSALVQSGGSFGFRAAPMVKDKNYETIEIRLGPTHLELTRRAEDLVKLDYFVAFSAQGGAGSKALGILTHLADEFCVKIEGFASPMAEFTHIPEFQPRPHGHRMKLDQLVGFYHRFGFEPIYTPKSMGGQRILREPNCAVV